MARTKANPFYVDITKPPHLDLLRLVGTQIGGASLKESLEHFLNCHLTGDDVIKHPQNNVNQVSAPNDEGNSSRRRSQICLKKPHHVELLRSAATEIGSTSLKDGLEHILNRYLMGNVPIKQTPSNVEQVPVKSENVADSPFDKVTRRFGTPKDRQSIENLKRIYLLDQMGFYEPCWPYFDPTSQSVIFYFPDDGSKFNADHPERLPPVAMLWSLWDIPDEHPSFSDITCIRWDWEIASYPLDGQLKEAFECLRKLDEILIRPIENKYGTAMLDEAAWEKRICGFFRGDFEKVLTSTQEALILEFVESSMARVSKELDEFYVPFVEIPV